MKTLEAQEQSVLSEYANGDESAKALLKKLFPGQDFNLSIMDRVKSYEDACAIKGVAPLTIASFASFPKNQQEYLLAVHQDDVINEVLNEGWSPDWRNTSEYKYYPYFRWTGGSGFSYFVYYCADSSSSVGSRRTYKTSELATYSGKQFIDIHRILHNPRPSTASEVSEGRIVVDRTGKVTDRIKSYSDACFEIDQNPLTIHDFAALPEKDRQATYAFHQLTIIARVLNEGWEPNWNNHSEYKYYPYFYHEEGGSGFSYYGYCCAFSSSRVGSRLVYKDWETAEYAGKQFLDIYRDLMVQE